MSNRILGQWITSSWAGLRRNIVEHFVHGDASPSNANILAYATPQISAGSGAPAQVQARLAFLTANMETLRKRIMDARGGRRMTNGVLSRSRQLAVEDSVEIVERLIGEMDVTSRRQHAGFKEFLTITHPGELRGIQPEHFWEAVTTIISESAVEAGADSVYIFLELGGIIRQVRAPGTRGERSGLFKPSQVTRDALLGKLSEIFHSQTREQLEQDHLSDVVITVDFFNSNRTPLRGRIHPTLPRGQNGVRGSAPDGELPADLKHLKGLQALSRKGGYCALKPLAVALDLADCAARGVCSNITEARRADKLLQKAAALATELGAVAVDGQGTFGSEVYQLFVDKYTDWRVVLVDPFGHVVRHAQGVWVGASFHLPQQPPQGYDWGNTIHICYDDGAGKHTPHFYRIIPRSFGPFGKVIMTIAGGSNRPVVCPECCERFTRASRAKHVCENGLRHRCEDCGWTMYADELERHQRIDDENPARQCEKCGEHFSVPCFTQHNPRCKGIIPHCPDCNHVYVDGEEEHESCDRRLHCLNPYCEFYRKKKMDEFDLEHHRCYIEPRKEKDGRKRKRGEPDEDVDDPDAAASDEVSSLDVHWAWDCESMAEKVECQLNGKPVHKLRQIVCLIVARCIGTGEERVFEGDECLSQFIRWANLETTGGKGKKRLWSHNGGKYDTRLVYDRIVQEFSSILSNSKSVFVGSKIFKLELPGCAFLDSINHLSMPLKAIPNAFGLDNSAIAQRLGITALKKGEFPYSFSTPENRNYIGRLPPIEAYQPERRPKRNPVEPKDDDEQGVRDWHAAESARIDALIAEGKPGWNLMEEELAYCRMDVLILAEGLKAWRAINLELGNCDPLSSMTLASHAHKTFLTKHLKPNSIPVLKAQSRLAKTSPNLIWADEDSLARPGYKGGRVGPTCLLYELTKAQIEAGWRIDLYDFRSEYPSRMWDQPYPIGDYQFQAYSADDPLDDVIELINREDGMVACEIDYPSDRDPLFHPYLHSVKNGKLTFSLEESPVINRSYVYPTARNNPNAEYIGPEVDKYSEWFGKVNPRHFIDHWNCRFNGTCVDGSNCRICRLFIGRQSPTYTIFEIREALKLGYKVYHVYWTLSTPKTSRDLFKSYLRPNYEMKLRNSSMPEIDWEDQRAVEEFVQHHADMGITITPAEGSSDFRTWFQTNPALKLCGKLMMNSQYGKLGENSRKTVTAFVASPEDELELLDNDGETMQIVGRAFYDNVAEYRVTSNLPNSTVGHTNVILAAYVTAYGRHLLFQQLNKFKERVLYYDTDSIVVVSSPTDQLPATGPYLGDLELEIKKAHSFVSTGAKTYAIKWWTPCKEKHYKSLGRSVDDLRMMGAEERENLLELVGEGSLRWVEDHAEYEFVKQKNKGISLNSNVSRTLNYALMKRMAMALAGQGEEELEDIGEKVQQVVFQWERDLHEFFVYFTEKSVVPTRNSLKGVIAGGKTRYTIMPFGWERFKGKWPWDIAAGDAMDVDD